MPRKVLHEQALNALATSESSDGLGVLYEDEFGMVYRYVKNAGATALVAAGCCLMKLGASSPKAALQRVLSPDAATGPATCLVTMPAGVPVTAIAPSGSETGDHGWIMVAGTKKVTVQQSATAVDQQAGCHAIATSGGPTAWAKPYTATIDSTSGGTVQLRCVELVASLATTGVATAASALVCVRCLN